jgi:tetratricopeptide (TPR) repeat protein
MWGSLQSWLERQWLEGLNRMDHNIIHKNRKLIPRWHTSENAFLPQLSSIDFQCMKKTPCEGFQLEESINRWKQNPNLTNAIDLFPRLKQTENSYESIGNEVEEFLRRRCGQLPPEVQRILDDELVHSNKIPQYSISQKNIYEKIRKLKVVANSFPRNSLAWADLGFYYTVLGEDEKADRAMTISGAISPNSSLIARAYSRYLVHQGDYDGAFGVLKRTGKIKNNPFIASAAVSIFDAFEVGRVDLRAANNLIARYEQKPYLISELAAALGTIELKNGASKKGKRLLDLSLVAPSENVISQCNWLQHKFGIKLPTMNASLIRSIESEVANSYLSRRYVECRERLLQLHAFQPFSDTVVSDIGYISIVALKDYNFVIDYSDNRIPKSHMSFGEINNLVVAKILNGDCLSVEPDLAILIQKAKSSSDAQKGIFAGTLGLYCMRMGRYEDGCGLYERAISYFEKIKQPKAVALAQYFYSQELERCDPEKSSSIRSSCVAEAKRLGLYEIIEGISVPAFQKKNQIKSEIYKDLLNRRGHLLSKFLK